MIAVYLGLLLVVAASVSLLVIYWDSLGATGVLALAVVYLAGYLGAGEILRRRDLLQPADVLEAVAVGWVGLATYAILELAGVWPEGASGLGRVHVGPDDDRRRRVAASLAAPRPPPRPAPPRADRPPQPACWPSTSPRSCSATASTISAHGRSARFVLPVGLAWIAIGLWLDVTRRRGYATWAHLAGLVLTASIAIVALVPKTVPGFARHRRARRARALLLRVRAALELHRDRRSRRPHGHAVGDGPPRRDRTARDRGRRDRLDLRRVALVALARVDPKRRARADAGGSAQLRRSPLPVVATPRAAARSGARAASARLTAFTIARNDAVRIEPWTPTPQNASSPTSASTYAAAFASALADIACSW